MEQPSAETKYKNIFTSKFNVTSSIFLHNKPGRLSVTANNKMPYFYNILIRSERFRTAATCNIFHVSTHFDPLTPLDIVISSQCLRHASESKAHV